MLGISTSRTLSLICNHPSIASLYLGTLKSERIYELYGQAVKGTLDKDSARQNLKCEAVRVFPF